MGRLGKEERPEWESSGDWCMKRWLCALQSSHGGNGMPYAIHTLFCSKLTRPCPYLAWDLRKLSAPHHQ
eukprot:scaffold64473_cov30-Tisochrysis_lutea.AAC.1